MAVAMRPERAAAACGALPTKLGTATFKVNAPSDGGYRFWAHTYSPSTGNDAFYMQVDQAYCQIAVGDEGIAAGQFAWIDYQNGNTSEKINLSLSAGEHTFTVAGLDPSVGIDKIILTLDASCVPAGDGANCTDVVAQSQDPQRSGEVPESTDTKEVVPSQNPVGWATLGLIGLVVLAAAVLIRLFKPEWLRRGREWIMGKVFHRHPAQPQPASVGAVVQPPYGSNKRHWWHKLLLLALAVGSVTWLIPTIAASANAVGYLVWNATVANHASIVDKAEAIGGKMLQFATGATATAPAAGGGGNSTTPGATTLNLPRIPWEGGSAYWAQFPKANAAGWDDPSFFPISIFLGQMQSADYYKSLGINT